MDIREIGVIDLSAQRIEYLSDQQRIVAKNIANADTPNYRALEMKPFSEVLSGAVSASQPIRTHSSHLLGSSSDRSASVTMDRKSPMSPNGNNVALEDQINNAAQVQASHSLATSLYKKAASMIVMSIK